MTPREREPDQTLASKMHYATTTNFRRFRQTALGDLESPIKAPYNQPTYNNFSQLTFNEKAGIKKKSPFGIDLYITPKYGETN